MKIASEVFSMGLKVSIWNISKYTNPKQLCPECLSTTLDEHCLKSILSGVESFHSPSSLVPHIEERYITIFRMQNNSQIIICENISRRWFALTLRFCSSHACFYYTLFLSDLFQGSLWLTKLFTGNAQDVSWARGCWQTAHHESSHLRDSDYMDGAGSERRSSS